MLWDHVLVVWPSAGLFISPGLRSSLTKWEKLSFLSHGFAVRVICGKILNTMRGSWSVLQKGKCSKNTHSHWRIERGKWWWELEVWSCIRTLVLTDLVIVEGPSWAKKKDKKSDKMGRREQGNCQTSSAFYVGLRLVLAGRALRSSWYWWHRMPCV